MSQEIPPDPSNHPHEQESQANSRPQSPNLPLPHLLNVRSKYLKIGVPLYEASIKCDWKAAEAILDQNKDLELVKCSITDNGETALHIAASAKVPKKVDEFVNNLVAKMNKEDLALENKNHNTALYLAAAAGNIKTVKIMLAKNATLHTIPGARGTMMPLYAAVLFGNKDVVKHLYKLSKDLGDDGWNHQNRGWLLEKCVEGDMFDIAIKIVQKYPELGRSNTLLGLLARKPDAFSEKKSNMIGKTIKLGDYIYSLMFTTHQPSETTQSKPHSGSVPENSAQPAASDGVASSESEPHSGSVPKDSESPNTNSNILGRAFKSVFAFFKGEPEKETEALELLKIIWGDILTLPKWKIDGILRGPPDPMEPAKEWVLQAIQLKELISEQLEDMEKTYPNEHQVPKLKKLVSRYVLKMHTETQNIIKEENKKRSSKRDKALELEKVISENIAKLHDDTQKPIKPGDGVKVLHGLISNHIRVMRKATSLKETYSSRAVFVAAKMGNTKFLVELIRGYPDLIWKVNDSGVSIFHAAAKHRQEDIYNLLYEIGAMKDMITPLKDNNDNNMLHLVGKIAKQKRLADVSGVALQMQRELLWFEEVKKMIPPSYRERKNKDDLTPHELFTKEHKELVTQGEKWMKGTANQCMVVAALIATIVFAAAFTVPGGYTRIHGNAAGMPYHVPETFRKRETPGNAGKRPRNVPGKVKTFL